MKWRGWLCSPLFVLLLLCVGGVIINQKNNVSALSDLTYTTTYNGSSFPDLGNFCNTNNHTPVDCTGYSHLLVEISSSCFASPTQNFPVAAFDGSNAQAPRSSSIILYTFDSSYTFRVGFYGYQISSISCPSSITYTLLDHNPFSVGAPSGSLSITENGTYDVTNYAEAVVDVPIPDPEVIPGDYHDDLVSINNAILIVPAVALVVYFFYAIYKMLLGGKTL